MQSVNTMKQEIIQRAHAWANSPYIDEQDRREVQSYLDCNDEKKLRNAFHGELAFGTGGVRALIGQGTNCINRYTIRRVTQAFANALINRFQRDIAICIGFDCRKFSHEFAREAAQVMAHNGIRVHLFGHITPTPVLSYAIRYFRAQGGIMITASHNPRDYNGYKAYWDDGCQVTPPNDVAIIKHYQKLDILSEIKQMDFDQAMEQSKISYIDQKCEDSYYQMIAGQCLAPALCQERGGELPIAFTALHGTGGRPVIRALQLIGMKNVYLVSEQQEANGQFPTVELPNPEEVSALEKVRALMKEKKALIALATDPDTDRLGVVAWHQGQQYVLNGNQIGLLLLHYILQTKRKDKTLRDNSLFIKTIVTSDLLAQVASSFGCLVENTLPGFKWICGKIREYEEKQIPFHFLFATEESFGYLSHKYCRDKDGVNACALMAEVALFHHTQGRTLIDALNIIYREYGYSCEGLLCLHYYNIEGAKKIERIMEHFRQIKGNSPGLLRLMQEQTGEAVTLLEDYLDQSITKLKNGERTKLDTPPSNALGLHFASGNKLYLRPSGTEPKIKFYTMVVEKIGSLEEKKKRAAAKMTATENFIKAQCEGI